MLEDAIERLVTALDEADHPLGSAWARPAGRDPVETQAVARDLFGFEMPAELVELWQWWGSNQMPLALLNSIGHARHLPGWFFIESIEASHRIFERHYSAELINRADGVFVPFMRKEDSHGLRARCGLGIVCGIGSTSGPTSTGTPARATGERGPIYVPRAMKSTRNEHTASGEMRAYKSLDVAVAHRLQ